MPSISNGAFVWTFDKYGLGQVIEVEARRCRVRFFQSIHNSFERGYDLVSVERAYLSPQTRAYVQSEAGIWSVGRVVDYFMSSPSELRYTVQLPNRRPVELREDEIRVRCLLPVEDPAAVLAAGGMETQYLHDRRLAAVRCIATARAASFGLTGLLSASVELLPHQVDVVRRVLRDPVQRYLLADEVGLGKTIEACAIIKQAVLDNPDERITVLAPPSLTGQWTKELSWRFFVDDITHNIHVLPFEQIDTVDPSDVDTLVVDEAHNLISTGPDGEARYEALRRLALAASRMILISATPVFGHEQTLLALLHLLDPQTYRIDAEVRFLDRLRRRQEIGRLLLALDASQRPALLRRTLHSLRETIQTDDLLDQLIVSVEASLGSAPKDVVADRVRNLHRHICDTYRLDQRLIRTRRRDLPLDVLAPRSSMVATLEEDDDDRTPLVVDALEQWRQRSQEAVAALAQKLPDTFEGKLVCRYARLYEALGVSVEACAEELRAQLDSVRNGHELSFQHDEAALAFALRQTEEDTEETRASHASRVIQNALRTLGAKIRFPRLVAFGTSEGFVLEVATHLEHTRSADVFRVVHSSSQGDVDRAIGGFLKAHGAAVLVCDRRGEEGLNLQSAHGIVHLDIPLAPARIEQRIGRLDRLGRGRNPIQQIHHWVIVPYCDDDNPWQSWFEVLRDAFQVFNGSISEMQFRLEELQSAAQIAVYRRGAVGLREYAPLVSRVLSEERQRLDEQYALDSRINSALDGHQPFKLIERVDAAKHYRPVDVWLTRVLEFGREPLNDGPAAFRLHWGERTLLPKEPWQELIRAEWLNWPMTYERSRAANWRNLRLVRPGLEIVDALERLLRWDDRGTAYATWRRDPRWTGEGRGRWLGFRLVYLVEANCDAAYKALGGPADAGLLHALRRRMDALLPPWTVGLDVDVEMNPVEDPLLREILDRPYSTREDDGGRRDFNLGSRRDALYEVIGFPELADACRRAKEVSEMLLRKSPQFEEWTATARSAVGEVTTDIGGLKRRNDAIAKESGSADGRIEREIGVNRAIATALSSPSVRLDAIGLFVVSHDPPNTGGPEVEDDRAEGEPESLGW